MTNLYSRILLLFIVFTTGSLYAQNVGVNTTSPHSSASLEVFGTDKGLLLPRVSLSNVSNATSPVASPATGLIVYNTNAAVTGGSGVGFYFFDGAKWERLTTSADNDTDWLYNGTHIYNANAGNVGIGTSAPQHKLTVGGTSADNQLMSFRVYSNDPPNWKGGAAFGYTTASVVMGELGGIASIGGHNADLTAWAILTLNSGGGNVGIGTTAPTENLGVQGNIRVSQSNTTGGGIVLADDGDIADMNDGFASMRFSYGVRYTNANRGGSVVNQIANGGGGYETYFNATNVGIGTDNPESLLHVMGRTHIHQAGAGGGQNRFEGVNGPTTDNGRAQLILSSAYSDLVIASSQGNDNHGSTMSFVAYNPGDANDYRKFVLNQGGWGARSGFLDFSYLAGAGSINPHAAAYAATTTMTVDGQNKRVGIGTMTPEAKVHVIANGASNPSSNGIYVYNPDAGGDAIVAARVNNSTGGDPFFSMDINGVQGWSMGADNSDADKFKIANAWDHLDVNTRMTITTGGYVGINTTAPNNWLDIQSEGRTGSHPSGRALYVTGGFGGSDNGVEFRHSNGTQGIGIGYNAIYATGSNADQEIGIKAKGNSAIRFETNGATRGYIHGDGTMEHFGRGDFHGGLRTERYYRYFSVHRQANGSGYQYDLGQWDYCAYAGHQIALGDDTFDGGSDNRRFVHECVVELNDVWTLNNTTQVTTQGGYAYNSRPNWYLYSYSWSQFDSHMNQHCNAVCVNFDY